VPDHFLLVQQLTAQKKVDERLVQDQEVVASHPIERSLFLAKNLIRSKNSLISSIPLSI
jgi:hypothetical protein